MCVLNILIVHDQGHFNEQDGRTNKLSESIWLLLCTWLWNPLKRGIIA